MSSNLVRKIDRRRKAVLIVECDSEKLTTQNLAVGQALHNVISSVFQENPIDLVSSSKESDLLKEFERILKLGRAYRSIIIVGHSNQDGLQISSDRFISWDGVANWIKPFGPHRIILLACSAGKWPPCASLFEGVPTLKEIFASPVPARKSQQFVVLGKVSHVLLAKKENRNLNQLMQMTNLLITKGIMFSRTRREYEHGDGDDKVLWALAERAFTF